MSERPSATLGLRHVALKCRELEPLERFYVDLLGYDVEWRPDAESVYLTNGRDNLALHQDAGAAAIDSRLDHMGILLAAEHEVDAWAAWLTANGVSLDTRPRTHRDGCRSFYVKDPEQNRIQFLWHPTLSAGATGRAPGAQPGTPD